MINRLLLAGFFAAVVVCQPLWAAQEDETGAVMAAGDWLAVVDMGNYDESWNGASAYFQQAVPKARWHALLTAIRKPLGEVVARKLKEKEYTTTLPDAPDGAYVVIQYETSFGNKASAVETVVTQLGDGGAWRVSGYFIK